MAKRLAVFIISLTALSFITSCSVPKPKPSEPGKVELVVVEPNAIEPNELQYNVVAEPNQAEPKKAEPVEIEPNVAKPRAFSFHYKCVGLLSNYVDDKGMVDYRVLKQKKLELKKLLDEFAKLAPDEYNRWPDDDKIAFWLNAYNIKMLQIVVDNYPIESTRWQRIILGPKSIRNIKGIWSDYKFIVMNEEFTLAEIDRRFFRGRFDDPRIFFAVSYASLFSPPLRNEPYYGNRLDEQLDNQVKRFLSRPDAFKIDREKRKVYLSAIFNPTWYGKEFISKYGTNKKFKEQSPTIRAVLNFITNYISRQDVSFLEIENYSVKFMRPDWTINE